jgi:tetratricopeptide (TPR) repeat protein
MDAGSIADRLLAAVWAESSGSAHGCPLSRALELVTGDGDPLSQQVEVAVAVETLVEQGHLQRQTTAGDELLVLTESGTERARTVHDELAGQTIELRDGEQSRTCTLSTAAQELDRSVVAVAADCGDDGTYYRAAEQTPSGIVDRQAELDDVDALLDRCRTDERGGAALVVGPAGIGKTTLVERIVDSRSVDTVFARCGDVGTEPYAPVRELVETLDIAADPFATVGPESLGTVETDATEAYEAQQTGLFHDVTARLEPTTGIRVLVFDDVHLADAGTRAYLSYLTDQLQDRRLLVLATARQGGLSEEPFVDEDPESAFRRRLELDAFDRDDTAKLIEQVVGRRGAPSAFVDAVQARTEGTPMFVTATVEALLEREQLDPQFQWYPETPAAIDLPEQVQDTVTGHVSELDETAQDIVRWLAVAEGPLSVGFLQTVCDRAPDRIATTVDVLVEAEFCERRAENQVALESNVTREALFEEMDSEQRRAYHRELARQLEASGSDEVIDRAASIARHYEQGEKPDTAIEWYRNAATRATEVYAHGAAIDHYNSILELARDREDAETLLSTGEQLATVYTTIGEYEQARQYVQFVRERVPDDDVGRRQRMAFLASQIASARGEFDRATEEVQAGLDLSAEPSEERCRLLLVKAEHEVGAGELDAARETISQQRAMARELDSPILEARGTSQLGSLADSQSEYDRARDHYEDALATFEDVGDRYAALGVRNHLGLVARKQGEFTEARRYHEQALADAEAIDARHSTGWAYNNLGLVAWRQSEYDDARESLERAIELGKTMQDRFLVALARLNLANVYREQAEYDQASEYYTRALPVFEQTDSRHLVGITYHDMGKLASRRGEYDRASKYCRLALDIYEELHHEHHIAAVRNVLGNVATRTGEYETALQNFDAALELAKRTDNDSLVGKIHVNLGVLEFNWDDNEAALEHSQRGIEILDEVGHQWFLGRAHLTMARVALDEGDVKRARDHAATAATDFERIGASHGVARARVVRGHVARERGDADAAREHYGSALPTFEDIDNRDDTLTVLESLVEVDRETDNEQQVREWCSRALAILEETDSPALEGCESWFRKRADFR